RSQTTSAIRIDHLLQFKEATEEFKNREYALKENEEKIKSELDNISIQKSLVQAQADTIKDMTENDFDLQRLQKTVQGYQFNVLTLSNELKGAKLEVMFLIYYIYIENISDRETWKATEISRR